MLTWHLWRIQCKYNSDMQIVSVRVWIFSSIPQKGSNSSLFLDTLSQQIVTVACHESKEIDLHAYTKKRDLKLKPKTGTLRPFVPLQGSWGHVYWCKLIMKSALIFCLPLILHLINWLTFHVIWCNFSIGLEQFWHLYCIATDEILPYIILVHMYSV